MSSKNSVKSSIFLNLTTSNNNKDSELLSAKERTNRDKRKIGELKFIDIKLKEKAQRKSNTLKSGKKQQPDSYKHKNSPQHFHYLEVRSNEKQSAIEKTLDLHSNGEILNDSERAHKRTSKKLFAKKASFQNEELYSSPLRDVKSNLQMNTKYFSLSRNKLSTRKELKNLIKINKKQYRSKVTPFRKETFVEMSGTSPKHDVIGTSDDSKLNNDVIRRSFSDPLLSEIKRNKAKLKNNFENIECDDTTTDESKEKANSKISKPTSSANPIQNIKVVFLTSKGDSIIQQYTFGNPERVDSDNLVLENSQLNADDARDMKTSSENEVESASVSGSNTSDCSGFTENNAGNRFQQMKEESAEYSGGTNGERLYLQEKTTTRKIDDRLTRCCFSDPNFSFRINFQCEPKSSRSGSDLTRDYNRLSHGDYDVTTFETATRSMQVFRNSVLRLK